jgi:hypothetical protein
MTITIDSIVYEVSVISCKRTADFLDKFAERTADGILHRELIGVYKNYKLQFGSDASVATYNALFDKLSEAVEFHTIIIPDGYTFIAYVSGVSDDLFKAKDGEDPRYRNLTCNFIAQAPAVT